MREIHETAYGHVDRLSNPVSPFHIVPCDGGRAMVIDRTGRNLVTGRPEPYRQNQDFSSPEIAEEWCQLRNLKVEKRSVYSD